MKKILLPLSLLLSIYGAQIAAKSSCTKKTPEDTAQCRALKESQSKRACLKLLEFKNEVYQLRIASQELADNQSPDAQKLLTLMSDAVNFYEWTCDGWTKDNQSSVSKKEIKEVRNFTKECRKKIPELL